MGDLGALGTAIYTLVDAATTLSVFYGLAPQGQPHPYVIVQRQVGADEHTFNSKGLDADYVVKVVTKDGWPTGAQRAYDAIHGQIEGGGTVTVSVYHLLRLERRSTIEYQDPGQFWHGCGLYRTEVCED